MNLTNIANLNGHFSMKLLFPLVLFFFLAVLVGCKTTPNLTKKEVYEILNEIIADDSLRLNIVCSKAGHLSMSEDYGFNASDEIFIKRQNEIFAGFKWEPNMLKAYSYRKKKPDYIYIDTSCEVGIVNRLSFPLVSVDRQKVVFENTEDCHCMLGGQGGKDVYIKQNGHWKREKSVDQWISQKLIQLSKGLTVL